MDNALIDCIELDDLPTEQRDLAEVIGIDAYIKLIKIYSGCSIYVAKTETVIKEKRNKQILKEFNGSNYRELAKKHNVTEAHLRRLINETSNEISAFGEQERLW